MGENFDRMIEEHKEKLSPIKLTWDSVGRFYKTRGGWIAKVIHHEYEKAFFCIHMLGSNGCMRTEPIKHDRIGFAEYVYPKGNQPPIPGNCHPADLVALIELSERWTGKSYVISHPNGVCWKWETKKD